MAAKVESSSSSRVSKTVRHGVCNTRSALTAGHIASLMVDYAIPSDLSFRVPDELDRANAPPEGFITVYEHHLRGGFVIRRTAHYTQWLTRWVFRWRGCIPTPCATW
ncbi:hypothetical protein Nepgr_028182 [Nepenthes gracilis]|uniref:Uncharacterized protein n=1 Tax=Nepenthes gracilis TaxID=150966 RepID=A0AAD3Y3V4_NEPGR|nr:hypothetical protein Nepgr_028182 [Nepenthes gracilis]